MNFLVNNPEGSFFYKYIDASHEVKTNEYLADRIDEVVEEIWENKVLQVINDSYLSYVKVGRELMKTKKSL